jgi:hypothetical protein
MIIFLDHAIIMSKDWCIPTVCAKAGTKNYRLTGETSKLPTCAKIAIKLLPLL